MRKLIKTDELEEMVCMWQRWIYSHLLEDNTTNNYYDNENYDHYDDRNSVANDTTKEKAIGLHTKVK